MSNIVSYILEIRKEFLVAFTFSVLYITYYLVEVVKKPVLVCRKGEFRDFLIENVPLVNEHFWPTPWCVDARLQTVVGAVLRTLLLPRLTYTRQVLTLADGGQVALDWVDTGVREGPVLLLTPGMSGDTNAEYLRCLAAAAKALPARCVVFNNRGIGGLPLKTPRLYSAVSYDDLAEAVSAVRARCPGVPILAAGVSLGGLILGQYLARNGPKADIAAALVISSPLDVEAGVICMERPVNAPLAAHLARGIRRTLRAHSTLRDACDLGYDWSEIDSARTVRDIDEAFTARHFGFGSAAEYYRAATLRDKLGAVAPPVLFLCAGDDPFQPQEALPARETEAAGGRVALLVTPRGGHIGFMEGWWPARHAPAQYLSRLALQYFGALLRNQHLLHRTYSHSTSDVTTPGSSNAATGS